MPRSRWRARASRDAHCGSFVRMKSSFPTLRGARARAMASDGATPAEASQCAKGELSYHYWHGKNAGEAPKAEAKVRRETSLRGHRRAWTIARA